MRYANRDDTFRIRQVTPAELDASDSTADPEFSVRVSRAANGWWTREELARLHARLGEALAMPVPSPAASAGNGSLAGEPGENPGNRTTRGHG